MGKIRLTNKIETEKKQKKVKKSCVTPHKQLICMVAARSAGPAKTATATTATSATITATLGGQIWLGHPLLFSQANQASSSPPSPPLPAWFSAHNSCHQRGSKAQSRNLGEAGETLPLPLPLPPVEIKTFFHSPLLVTVGGTGGKRRITAIILFWRQRTPKSKQQLTYLEWAEFVAGRRRETKIKIEMGSAGI